MIEHAILNMDVSTYGTWIRNIMMQKIINPVYVYSLPLAGVPLPPSHPTSFTGLQQACAWYVEHGSVRTEGKVEKTK